MIPLSVAPMMDYTDRHCRYFLRLLTQKTLLYTEMITTGAILHGDRNHLLAYHPDEHPIALQIGGNDPKALAKCAKIAEQFGYDEINLNVGCPSERVHSGAFGLCLMLDENLVARAVEAMKNITNIPVTVKTRIGVDHQDSYQALHRFVKTIVEAGVDAVIIHARKGWLNGLSPKENRTIPPLNYPVVYQIKQDFAKVPIAINGGIQSLAEAKAHLQHVDSVMIGRAACHTPFILAQADQVIFNQSTPTLTREEAMFTMLPYIENRLQNGTPLGAMMRHLLGLFHGEAGARQWRRTLSENMYQQGAGIEVIDQALKNKKGA